MTHDPCGPRGLARILGGLWLVGAGIWACSTGTTSTPAASPCTGNPAACPSGTTCWPATTSAALECLPTHDGGAFGGACVQQIGVVTCAEGLACDQVGPDAGSCTYYCGSASGRTCPKGFGCYLTNVGGSGGPTVELCRKLVDGGMVAPLGDAAVTDASIGIPFGGGGVPDGTPAQR